MLVLGLTGSAGMGKSTVAAMFAECGVAVFDADRTVHELYRGEAVALIAAAFPTAISDGVVDRAKLGSLVFGDRQALSRLEGIVHPLVRAAENRFRAAAAAAGRRIALLDVPLLLEGEGEGRVDAIVVVSAPAAIQRERLIGRPGMTESRLESILSRQMPDAEKRRHAHFIIDTRGAFDRTREAVRDVLRAVAPLAAGR